MADETPDDEDDGGSGKATIALSEQLTATEIRIDSIETEVDAQLEVVGENGRAVAQPVVLDAGDELTDYTISYTEALDESQTVTAKVVADGEGTLASASASVQPGLVELSTETVTLVDASPDHGFEYPYFAYVPADIGSNGPVYVEPNNTGTSTDDFEKHRLRARELLKSEAWQRKIPEQLGVPYLVPVFPRPRDDPESWRHYVHALDAETMSIDDGPLKRVDLQLLSMIDHFRASLKGSLGYTAATDVHLNGYSASGNFVNRFTALHPDRVRAVTAGGVNGTLILPRSAAKDRSLPYPIGVEDVTDLTGDEFDEAAWTSVPQFVYLGEEDTNDTIPYDDAWNAELREIALDVYGEDMQDDRMPYCESVYEDAGANAQFHVYGTVGHTVGRWMIRDIYEFHHNHLEGESDFKPIDVRDAPAIDVGFETPPSGGDTQIDVRITIPADFILDGTFSGGSVSVMLDTGTEIEWRNRIGLTGDRHILPDQLPAEEVRSFSTDQVLESGTQVTVGLMDGAIVTDETVTVE
ncbi:hypothetical protein [Halovivax ruber]|nr:hypothetical protein [Halovivax ruber]